MDTKYEATQSGLQYCFLQSINKKYVFQQNNHQYIGFFFVLLLMYALYVRANILFIFPPLQPQTLQLDFLMKILPNYHHLKKTVKASHNPS